jgi:diphosphomevalonate decarboxylase
MTVFKNVQGKTGWRSPSNIALVKYWGKYGRQLPKNPSVSLTLSQAFTETFISYRPLESGETPISLTFTFEGASQPAFEKKIRDFLSSIILYFPFLEGLHLDIISSNSFPHSTGIASSASSMSALALCLCQIESNIYGGMRPHEFFEKASLIARLGSGSACRSVYPAAAIWGKHDRIPFSSNEHAIPVGDKLHEVFRDMCDTILIVSSEEKEVSSRAGHALMEGNPYAEVRYSQANNHMLEILDAMQTGDLSRWGNIIEKEALTLHALMMASEPPFILMQPGTLTIIRKIKKFRSDTGVPVYFTLDAGPNLHLMYPAVYAAQLKTFIEQELLTCCENGKVLFDHVGKGPEKIA